MLPGVTGVDCRLHARMTDEERSASRRFDPAPPTGGRGDATVVVDDDSTRVMPTGGPLPQPTRQAMAGAADATARARAAPNSPAGAGIAQPDAPASREPPDTPAGRLPPDMPLGHTLPVPDTSLPHSAPISQTLPGKSALPGVPVMRQVGRYRIGERLGRGGMATVFQAHDPDIGRDVAIKFLHATLCEDEEYHARFLREARAAGGLSHANIVTVHDVGEIEGRPYMAMELIDGKPLSDELADGKPLPLRDVVVMGIQLARALAYAHARGIVHRDIKPGNVMRVRGTNTIKVTDFGIAHMDSTGAEHRTRVGDILGTPQYMSPEQAQGERLDGRSDLFSSGILLYQMLTGRRPFLGDSLVALAVKIAREEPAPMESLRSDLPAALRRVVERCLAKAPDRRFQTGEELADALGRVLHEIDEDAAHKDKPRSVPLRVKWAGMMALIVAVVMGLTAGIVTNRQNAAMVNQMVDSGAALARFIAAQNAAPVLGDEWDTVDISLKEIMKTGDFQSITVIDRAGTVRAASQAERVGQPYVAPAGEVMAERDGSLPVTRYVAAGEAVLGFAAPITFGGKRIGQVALGLREKELVQVAQLSRWLMAVLVVVTVLGVAVAMFFVANWFARPVKLVAESMREIAKGRFDHRIREQRRDEFGELYLAFDQMAQALQDRQAGAGTTAPATVVTAPAQAAPNAAAAAGAAGAAPAGADDTVVVPTIAVGTGVAATATTNMTTNITTNAATTAAAAVAAAATSAPTATDDATVVATRTPMAAPADRGIAGDDHNADATVVAPTKGSA
jgi:methyl-accepting chemotaxis protein